MASPWFHRELLLPPPNSEPVPVIPLILPTAGPFWLEIEHGREGRVHYVAGACSLLDLDSIEAAICSVVHGADFGPSVKCPARLLTSRSDVLLRARALIPHHFAPLSHHETHDVGSLLIRALSSRVFVQSDVTLQILFRRMPTWEHGIWSSPRPEMSVRLPESVRAEIARRAGEAVYHVELRAGVSNCPPGAAVRTLNLWLAQWMTIHGSPWRVFERLPPRKQAAFRAALLGHDITSFTSRKSRRDVSASELTRVLSIPRREEHPGCQYVGAPVGRPQPLLARPGSDPPPVATAGSLIRGYRIPASGWNGGRSRPAAHIQPRVQIGIDIGTARGQRIRLPEGWHHLAILGRTRTGKSTLALNIVLQLLAREPGATVVVLEPSGDLIRAIVERATIEIARSTIEIDPSHPTFDRAGLEMASLPLNLVHRADPHGLAESEVERRAERAVGDLLQSIKNAWGEESIGGRADFVLRAVVQGLGAVQGTNLVDAYSVLSDRQTLRRLEELVEESPLREALRATLPKLDHSVTISSLDKVGKIATNPLLRKTLCQRFHPISFAKLLRHRLLLLNLAKGELGTEASNFLGALFLTQLWSALQERTTQDAPVYLVVDEFHNFAIPAFADMLSEGARHGLHVVAITQYLSRIPERIRSALIGNADAWTFFSMGAEDVREAWQILQGGRFGWVPDHLVSGLGPYQAAFAPRGSLLKVNTSPASPVPSTASVARQVVRESSLRYASPEDSEASPLAVSTAQVAALLGAVPESGLTTREELRTILGWRPQIADAAIALCGSRHDLEEQTGQVVLRTRGLRHLEALKAARNEGDLHTSLLTDAAIFLDEKGIHVRIVPQEGGYLRPDAEFERWQTWYSMEVECSTLAKHTDQVARNVRKALAAGRKCLLVVADWEAAQTMAGVVAREAPEARLWGNVGLIWRAKADFFELYRESDAKPWGFLAGQPEPDSDFDPQTGSEPEVGDDEHFALPADPAFPGDLERVRKQALQLTAAGRWEVTIDDFGAVGQQGSTQVDPIRLGMALESLGVKARRERREGRRVRLYDLRALSGSKGDSIRSASDATVSRD